MATKVRDPELEQFKTSKVELTGKILGTGSYGYVEEAKIPGGIAAAKIFHRRLMGVGNLQAEKWGRDFVTECRLMSKLRHPSIVQFLGICYLPVSELPILLMEKLPTTLDSLLEDTPNICIEIKVQILTGTASGLVFLHSQIPPIAHRDLTARNILIDSNCNAKISDLGASRIVRLSPGQMMATMTAGPGNLLYMPPEAQTSDIATEYNVLIDVFSFGVTSLFTLTQLFPKNLKPCNFQDQTTNQLVARTEIERREEYVSSMKATLGEESPLVKLTLECLEYSPQQRPSAQAVLECLEEIRGTLPKEQSKIELVSRITERDREFQIIQEQYQVSSIEKQTEIDTLQAEKIILQSEIGRLKSRLHSLQVRPVPKPKPKSKTLSLPSSSRAHPTTVCAEKSILSLDKPVFTGRVATVCFYAVNFANKPCLENVILDCKLVHVKSGRERLVKVSREVSDSNKYALKIKPVLRGSHELRVIIINFGIKRLPLTVAPHPYNMSKPTNVVIKGQKMPHRIAVNSKENCIVTKVNGRVCIFDRSWIEIRSFGSIGSGDGQFDRPAGVAVDCNDNIFIADCGNNRIQKFSPEGNFHSAVGSEGSGQLQFKTPFCISYSTRNGLLYIGDQKNRRVQVLTTELKYHSSFVVPGNEVGKSATPTGISCDEHGMVFVTDSDTHRVQVFNWKGELLRVIGSYGNGVGELDTPTAVAVSSGLVYVCEFRGCRISIFTVSGEFVGSFGTHGSDAGKFDMPLDVFVDAEQNIIISDCNNDRLQIF